MEIYLNGKLPTYEWNTVVNIQNEAYYKGYPKKRPLSATGSECKESVARHVAAIGVIRVNVQNIFIVHFQEGKCSK